MADKGPGSTGRSKQKRLARAKIKPTDTGIKSSKGRKTVVEEQTKTQQKAERKKKITAVAIGIFAVIMALSMMLPSLSYIFGSPSEKQAQLEAEQQAAEQEAAKAEDEAADEEAAEEQTGVALVDANYKAVVEPLEKKLEENQEDLATLLNLGNDYVSWASEASAYASEDEGLDHVNELYQKALDYYDRYLKLNDSAVVKSNRAMVQLYMGDFDAATEALKAVTAETPEYGPAWVDLGRIYEFQGMQDEAKAAYQSAIDADPDDEYGSKTYASQRIASMAAQTTDITEEDEATAPSTSDVLGGASALEDALEKGGN